MPRNPRPTPGGQPKPAGPGSRQGPRGRLPQMVPLTMDPDYDPWEQQPGESDRNFAAFAYYRDLGRRRSVPQAAELIGLSPHYLYNLAKVNKWTARAKDWDTEQDRLYSLTVVDQRKDMMSRHVKASRALMDKALARLNQLDISRISPHALILMIDTAAKIERAALGLEDASTRMITATATTARTTDAAGNEVTEMRVDVGVMHENIMAGIGDLVARMSPEQIAAGYRELTAEAATVNAELDAALPSSASPPALTTG